MMNRQPENGHIGFRPPLLSPKGSLKMACGRLANILAEWKHSPHSVQPFGEEPSPFRFGFQAASGSWQTSQLKPLPSSQAKGSLKTRFPVFRLPFHCPFKKSILPAAAQRLIQPQQILPFRQPCPHQRFLRLAGGDFGG